MNDLARAVAAATAVVTELGLAADEAIVVQASNRLTLRLLPCDVVARVASAGHEAAQFEVELAMRLDGTEAPVAPLDPRVPPRVHEHDGFRITLWTWYDTAPSSELAPTEYADALARLHAGLRTVDLATPHFTDRVREAEALAASADRIAGLADADRDLVLVTLTTASRAILDRQAPEQLLHGEPHPGNLLNTAAGPLFIDLETCCQGPLEFDLAHVPEAVSDRYPNVDQALLRECRVLVLAMVAAWRFDPQDQLPSGRLALRETLLALRAGPPYPALGAITGLH